MHPFSQKLSGLLSNRDVNKAALGQYLNIDRSTLHKFLNGKRLPSSLETVDRIGCFLSLTEEELTDLKETWEMEKTGPVIYYGRKSVHTFLEGFRSGILPGSIPAERQVPVSASCPSAYSCDPQTAASRSASDQACIPEDPFPGHRLLRSKASLLESLQVLLALEVSKPGGRIALLFQPDQEEILYRLLSLKEGYPCRIDHIFCLPRNIDPDDCHELVYLRYLAKIFPLLYKPDVTYRSLYFYDDMPSHFAQLDGWPFLFLTSSCALTARADLTSGILYTQKDIVQIYWDLFRRTRQLSSPFTDLYPVTRKNVSLLDPLQIYVPVIPPHPAGSNLVIGISDQEMALVYKEKISMIREFSLLSAFRDYLDHEKDNLYTDQNGKSILRRELCPYFPKP